MYKIGVKSDYEELYRYNLVITCAGYDAQGEQLYVTGVEKIYSEEFNETFGVLPPIPLDFIVGESLTLECETAEKIHVIVYVVTTSLPKSRLVDDSPPFDLEIRVERDSETIYELTHQVNQWGGASINIKL
ncbi:MAG: hypothetical protein R3Y16_03300 [Rikenellaceae bacterium]